MPESPSTVPCPKCGELLTQLWSDGQWQFYRCSTHGIVVLPPPDGAKPKKPST